MVSFTNLVHIYISSIFPKYIPISICSKYEYVIDIFQARNRQDDTFCEKVQQQAGAELAVPSSVQLHNVNFGAMFIMP